MLTGEVFEYKNLTFSHVLSFKTVHIQNFIVFFNSFSCCFRVRKPMIRT